MAAAVSTWPLCERMAWIFSCSGSVVQSKASKLMEAIIFAHLISLSH